MYEAERPAPNACTVHHIARVSGREDPRREFCGTSTLCNVNEVGVEGGGLNVIEDPGAG